MQEEDEDPEFVVTRFAYRSFDDEFGGTINDDLAMLQIAVVCVVVFTAFAMSNCKDGFVGRRSGLTWAGATSIVFNFQIFKFSNLLLNESCSMSFQRHRYPAHVLVLCLLAVFDLLFALVVCAGLCALFLG